MTGELAGRHSQGNDLVEKLDETLDQRLDARLQWPVDGRRGRHLDVLANTVDDSYKK
jgi:hypothetical protein